MISLTRARINAAYSPNINRVVNTECVQEGLLMDE